MLTKDDLKAIKNIVDESVGEFAKDVFVPFTTYVEEKFEKVEDRFTNVEDKLTNVEDRLTNVGSDMESIDRRLEAAFSRDDRQDEKIKKLEKKIALPAFA